MASANSSQPGVIATLLLGIILSPILGQRKTDEQLASLVVGLGELGKR